MRLPCSICSLAWNNPQTAPSVQTWSALEGRYFLGDDGGRILGFESNRHDTVSHNSNDIVLIPWTGEFVTR
jgi:hypothetical protein